MSKLVSRIAPRSCGASPSGVISESAPTWVSWSQRPAIRPAVGIVGPVDHLLEQLDLVPAQVVRPAFGDPGDARGQSGDAEDVGRSAFEKIGEHGRLGRRSTSRRRFLLRARREAGRRRAGRRKGARAGRPVKRLVARERQQVDGVARRSIGTTPADWAASTRNRRLGLAHDRGDRLDRLHRPQHVRRVGHARRATSWA